MKGFLRGVPNGPMTRQVILGIALVWLAACHHVNNVGDEGPSGTDSPDAGVSVNPPDASSPSLDAGECVDPILVPCANDQDCTSFFPGTVCEQGTCACPPMQPPPPPPTCTPPVDNMGNPVACLPAPIGCQLYENTICDALTSTCVCPPPQPPPPACTAPVDNMGNPVACLPAPLGCQLYEGTICDPQTSTCVCP